MIRKRFHQYWVFEAPEAVLTCSILKYVDKRFLIFGGHDKTLYLMDEEFQILDYKSFDGWCRCCYPIDLDGDGCDEVLVGTGDGRFIVLKLNKKRMKFEAIMNCKFTGMINCCVGGDLYRDGNLELIFGSEDKTLKIFKDINSNKPIITFYYDSWVTACTLGFLKLPQFSQPIYGLLIGTKNGLLQLVQIKDDKPDIIWQQYIYSEVNDIKIGDVTNDGYNEIIVASDDTYVKIYNSKGKRLKFIKIDRIQPMSRKNRRFKSLNRPKTLLIEDIDGDKANEIVVGCADGSLRVFHNTKLNSKHFELKWKAKYSASIKDICSFFDVKNKIPHIIFGGYERSLRNISDFEINEKPLLKIPSRFKIPEIPLKKGIKNTEAEIVPTNLRDFIIRLIIKKGFYLTLDFLIDELLEKGYSRDEIVEEIELMKTEKILHYGKIDNYVWSLSNKEIDDLIDQERVNPIRVITKESDDVLNLKIEKNPKDKKYNNNGEKAERKKNPVKG
ncbi:MAG: hypothetical protein ACFFAN_15660 [Promethearchaeota archaeon]